MCDATRMRSLVWCGAAPWPPREPSLISNSFEPAYTPPTFAPIVPTGSSLLRCMAKQMSGFTQSSTPSLIIAPAPSPPSSAGWNRNATEPFCCAFFAVMSLAMTSPTAVCPSWPQACMSPGVFDANA